MRGEVSQRMEPKPPAASALRSTELVMPDQATPEGFLRAGVLMEWVDYLAGMTAVRHCRHVCVTRYVDRMVFDHPIRVGHAVHLYSRVTWTGRSSMEITVDIAREDLRTGETRVTNQARLVFVAVDDQGRPLQVVPPLQLTTAEEEAAFAAAEARRQQRRAPAPDDFDWQPQIVRTHMVLPRDMNPHGILAGGVLMGWMDYAAQLAAMAHTRGPVAPKSVDDLNFDLPIRQGHAVHVAAAVTWTGRTSCEVAVTAEREDMKTGERVRTHTAYWTFVALGEDLRPAPIRPYVAATPEDAARLARAEARQRARRGL